MTEKNKVILDATAGFRMMWFDKNHPNCLYIDERKDCNPDEVQDFRNLPYPDESFKLIVFDPPHYLDKWHNPNIKLNQDYGLLRFETWQSDLKKAFKELWRVLAPFGVLVFKWNNHDVDYKEVYNIFPVKPLFGQQIKKSRSKKHPCSTKWFTFMKFPKSFGGKQSQ
jgi:hypothetical protein